MFAKIVRIIQNDNLKGIQTFHNILVTNDQNNIYIIAAKLLSNLFNLNYNIYVVYKFINFFCPFSLQGRVFLKHLSSLLV